MNKIWNIDISQYKGYFSIQVSPSYGNQELPTRPYLVKYGIIMWYTGNFHYGLIYTIEHYLFFFRTKHMLFYITLKSTSLNHENRLFII